MLLGQSIQKTFLLSESTIGSNSERLGRTSTYNKKGTDFLGRPVHT